MGPGVKSIRFPGTTKPPGGKRLVRFWAALFSGLRPLALVLALAVSLSLSAFPAQADTKVLSGVPEYYWTKGCSPTSGGMLMGYWFNQGYTSLLPGVTDAYSQDAKVNQAISGIAGYMHTTANGGTYADDIPTGLKDWATSVGMGTKTAYHDWVSYGGGTFDYADYQAEINAGRPMILNLETYKSGFGWVGHSVVGYGYQDAMFNIKIPTGSGTTANVTVAGFAVMDTWMNGVGAGKQSGWLDWDGTPLYSLLQDGVEWWPFLDMTLTGGWDYTNYWDWQVVDGVFYQPVPAPATLLLFASGLATLVIYRRKPRI